MVDRSNNPFMPPMFMAPGITPQQQPMGGGFMGAQAQTPYAPYDNDPIRSLANATMHQQPPPAAPQQQQQQQQAYDPGFAASLTGSPLFMAGMGMLGSSLGNITSMGRSGGNPIAGLMAGLQSGITRQGQIQTNAVEEQERMKRYGPQPEVKRKTLLDLLRSL